LHFAHRVSIIGAYPLSKTGRRRVTGPPTTEEVGPR
jgi:hypothetical protein